MKIDLHIHTKFSWDGFSTPKEIVDAAIQKGIDCICVADHGQIQGAIEAMKYGFDKNILVIPGIEIMTLSGDILGINVKKIIPDFRPALETIQEIKKQGGMAVIPHPFWVLSSMKNDKEFLLAADAIEIFNADMFRFINKKARLFAKEHNLVFTAGSDAHWAKFVGRAYLEIPQNNLSDKEVIGQIKNRTGLIRGKALNLWEKMENSLKVSVKDTFYYYYNLRSKQRQYEKEEKLKQASLF
jgi:predicted metal-dependent phosphoesterase TrpH